MLHLLLKIFKKPIKRILGSALIKGAWELAGLCHAIHKETKRQHAARKEGTPMKKNALIAAIAALAAVAGALAAIYLYLRRREKELDEYEHLLFSEDFDDKKPESAKEEAAPEKIEPAEGDAE